MTEPEPVEKEAFDRRADQRRDAYPSLYCAIWPGLKAKAKELGYALLIHGSLKRDLDLVAVPWVEDAVPARDLVNAVVKVCGGWVGEADAPGRIVADKPHGRAGSIVILGGHAVIDLSIMPLAPSSRCGRCGKSGRCGCPRLGVQGRTYPHKREPSQSVSCALWLEAARDARERIVP